MLCGTIIYPHNIQPLGMIVIFGNITVGTFHHGEKISDSGLKTVTGTSQWVFVRYSKTIVCHGQVR